MKEINAIEFEELVKGSEGRVIVDFFATWCGPCKMLAPILEKVAEDNTDIEFYKVDVDKCDELAALYGIVSIPTLICFEKGEEVKRQIGGLGRGPLNDFVRN
ncbi:MAG: thioredoxin [Ruminococcaceae bacterium]|nr:thioredoxin [Oscillospiraceae bacterium]